MLLRRLVSLPRHFGEVLTRCRPDSHLSLRPCLHTSSYPLLGARGRKDNPDWASQYALKLTDRERQMLLEALVKTEQEHGETGQTSHATPLTGKQLRLVALSHGVPFIGFGFLDNAIMIVAGEYIDFTFGTVLGFSTMAAAGLGNLVSDLVGIWSVGYVENFATKIGVVVPPMTSQQLHLRATKWASGFGRSLGIVVGCLLGMIPLLFFDYSDSDKRKESSE